MNARLVLSNLAPAVAVILSGCCSMDDVFEPRRNAAAPAPKRPLVQANSPTPKSPEQGVQQWTAGVEPRMSTAAPAAQKPALPDRSRLNQLDSEELAIRNNKSLSPAERNQQLQRVWKEQTEASSGIQAKDTSIPQQRPASQTPSPATSQPYQPKMTAGTPQTTPTAAAAQKTDEPKYAIRVPGKSGIIKSPYDGKLLDATGVPPGTEVKDPSTGKIMLVP